MNGRGDRLVTDPQVDHVAAGAEGRRALDERGLVPVAVQRVADIDVTRLKKLTELENACYGHARQMRWSALLP